MFVTEKVPVSTRGDTDVIDLTDEVQALVKKHAIGEGQALIFVTGSTAGLTTIEYEPGLVRDLPELFERLAPHISRNMKQAWAGR